MDKRAYLDSYLEMRGAFGLGIYRTQLKYKIKNN